MGSPAQPPILGVLNNAVPKGQGAVGAPVQNCPRNSWKLNVKIEIAPGYKYAPSLGIVGVALDGINGTTDTDMDHGMFTGPGSQPIVQFTGCNAVQFKVTGIPADDEWMMVAGGQVSLAPGDNKNLTLRVKSKPWIRVSVLNDDTKKPIDGIAIDLELPGTKKVSHTTAAGQPVYIGKLDPGTAKLEKMSDAGEVWEMVRIESA